MLTARTNRLRGLLDPWGEFARVADGLLAGARPLMTELYPALNVWTSEEETVVIAELPGYEPEDLDISVKDQTLAIKARRSLLEVGEGEEYARQERRHGEFARAVNLPYLVDSDKVSASYENGILEIRLPRAEADRPRRIEVKTV